MATPSDDACDWTPYPELMDGPEFADVVGFIAKFERGPFLKRIADISSSDLGVQAYAHVRRDDRRTQLVAAHMLARVALTSARFGRVRGAQPTRSDVLKACDLWASMRDPLQDMDIEGVEQQELQAAMDSYFVRTSWDQFPVQARPQDEFRRWFGIYRRGAPAAGLEEYLESLWNAAFSIPLERWYRAAYILWLLIYLKGPRFTLGQLRSWSDRSIGLDDVLAVVSDLSMTCADIEREYPEIASDDRHFERYAFNPLTARPIVKLTEREFVVPVTRLFGNALGLATLYRLNEVDASFPRNFGSIFEQYVGDVLKWHFGAVTGEEAYSVERQRWRGVDWTVIADDSAILVECRTGRIAMQAKTTGDIANVRAELAKRYGPTISHFATKIDHIARGLTGIHPNLMSDSVIQLLVTNEPLHLDARYAEMIGVDPKSADSPVILDISSLQALLSVRGVSLRTLVADYKNQYVSGPSGSIGNWLWGDSSPYRDLIEPCPILSYDRDVLLPHDRNPYLA